MCVHVFVYFLPKVLFHPELYSATGNGMVDQVLIVRLLAYKIPSKMCCVWVCIALWLFLLILAEYVLGTKTSNFRNISGKEFVCVCGMLAESLHQCATESLDITLWWVWKPPKFNLTRFRCVALISLNQNTKIVWYSIPVTSV